MATRTNSKSAPSPSNTSVEAIASLMADHKRVKALFKQFEEMREGSSDDEKTELVHQICDELTIHTTIEEEIFYPAARKAIENDDLLDEALVEHAGAKDLIAQLQDMEAGDELYDAKVTVLGEQIEHHVKEEEGEMFPMVRKSKVDTAALGREMDDRRTELMAELALDSADEGDDESESDDEVADSTAPRKSSAARR